MAAPLCSVLLAVGGILHRPVPQTRPPIPFTGQSPMTTFRLEAQILARAAIVLCLINAGLWLS